MKRDGASNSLRFFERRKAGMTEPRGKSSFNFGLECKIDKCFLTIFLKSGKFGLKVVTKGNNFFASFARVWSKSFLEKAEALEN